MADLLSFVLRMVDEPELRRRVQDDAGGVVALEVDDADGLTGEDVEVVAGAVRGRLPVDVAALVDLPGSVRPVDEESPHDAALRLLVGLAHALDGPSVEPVTLPHRELRPDPPPPATVARGGGEPVPREPPGRRWLHPVIPDTDP